MSDAIKIELKNFGRLQEVADKYPAVAEKHVGYAIRRALTRLMGEAKVQAPQGVSTFLKNRWEVKIGRFEGALISGASYAMAVHKGSRPHWTGVTDPNSSLRKWAIKKGLNPYAVQRSIALKGTRPNPFLERSAQMQESNMDREMQNAIKEIISNV